MTILRSPNINLCILLAIACYTSCSPRKKAAEPLQIKQSNSLNLPPLDSQTHKAATKAPAALPAKEKKEVTTHKAFEEYQQKVAKFKFEAFPVKERYYGKAAALDLVSHEDARYYRKTLTRGLALGSNFAGRYTLVSIGCGTACQVNYVVETKTGKVLDKVPSNSGVSFRADSRLLIVNPPEPTPDYPACLNCGPEIYVLENGLLYKAKLMH